MKLTCITCLLFIALFTNTPRIKADVISNTANIFHQSVKLKKPGKAFNTRRSQTRISSISKFSPELYRKLRKLETKYRKLATKHGVIARNYTEYMGVLGELKERYSELCSTTPRDKQHTLIRTRCQRVGDEVAFWTSFRPDQSHKYAGPRGVAEITPDTNLSD